jgi:hypothetical protein
MLAGLPPRKRTAHLILAHSPGISAGPNRSKAVYTRPCPTRRAVRHVSAAELKAAVKDDKHHYIPVFYTKKWAGQDGRLCEYSRPYDVVKPRRKHPDATGFVRGLYTLPDAPPGREHIIETDLMGSVDNWAALAQERMSEDGTSIGRLETRVALGWCQFLYSLIVRNPEHLLLIKQKLAEMSPEILENARDDYPRLRGPDDPPTFDEFKARYAHTPLAVPPPRVLVNIIGSKRVAKKLATMKWVTKDILGTKHTLLTSDRPVVMTNGLDRSDAHIVLPISPRKLFIAAKEEQTLRHITSMSAEELLAITNDRVASQAYNYVYGADDTQLRFVANRLGRRERSSPLG